MNRVGHHQSQATAARRWRAATAVAAALMRYAPAGTSASALPTEYSLGQGAAGVALFLAYWGAVSGDMAAQHRSQALLHEAVEVVADAGFGPSLYAGVAGIAWTIAHLERQALAREPIDLGDVDDALLDLVDCKMATLPLDLVSGLTGYGVYFLERFDTPAGRLGVARVVRSLAERSHPDRGGVRWLTTPDDLPPWQVELWPEGKFDFGMAHGVAGIVAFLAGALRVGVESELATRLLRASLEWLFAHELDPSAHSRFPAMLANGKRSEPRASRAAWCYGDPGLGSALLSVADVLCDTGLRRRAVDVLQASATLRPEDAGVDDLPLCHGAVGLAHLYRSAAVRVDDARLRDAANEWFAVGLGMRCSIDGIAGVRSLVMHTPNSPPEWRALPGFLEGAAGVGLAMLASVTARGAAWDRVLLLSY